MTGGVDIGGRSRRFQAAVIVVTILALLAAAFAAATLDSASPVDIDLGDRSVDGGDIGVNGSIDGGSRDGGGGVGLPDFILDIIGGIVDGDGSGDGDLQPIDPGEGEIPPPPYNITLDPTPTPGTPVVVTVEKNGVPVPFVFVAFNGERVGRTGPTGQLRARVPYTEELTVTATPPESDDDSDGESGGSGEPFALGEPGGSGVLSAPDGPAASGAGLLGAPARSGGPAAPGAGLLGASARSGGPAASGAGLLGASARSGGPAASGAGLQAERGNSSAAYDLPTDVVASVDGVALPGESETVRFTIAGNPLPAVEVHRNGRRVAITGSNGTADIPVPADAPLAGSVSVTLAREEFDSEATVEVGDVTAEVETGLLALPATGATVELSAVDSDDTEQLAGVPVTVTDGGEQVAAGETGQNGTMSFTLPWTNSVTATGATGSGLVSARVTGIFLSLAGVVGALALVFGGVAVWVRQNPATRRRGRERLVGLLLAAGDLLERTARRVARVVRNLPVRGAAGWLWGGLGWTAAWLRNRLVSGAGLLRDGLLAAARRLREGAWLALVLAGPRWLLGRLVAGVLWLADLPSRVLATEGDTVPAERVTGESQSTSTAESQHQRPQSAYDWLRRYWRWLVRRVVGDSRTKTPTEIERRAVERGWPEGPVRRLRRAFQEVEYGPADAEDRVDDARSARERLDEEEQ